MLALDMVPPKVERQVGGDTGVSVMWVAPTRSFAEHGGVPRPPPAQAGGWNRQLVKAKMFQNLIGDIDPNLGNWLVNPSWQLILGDHSRALTDTTRPSSRATPSAFSEGELGLMNATPGGFDVSPRDSPLGRRAAPTSAR